MPKDQTKEIQILVKELGERLGFEAHMEESLHQKDTYAPVYDVVWYLNIDKVMKLDSLKTVFNDDIEWFNKIKRIPFVGFEIEGANSSSKNQLSNFANLYSGDFIYNFVIVNNKGAKNEEDTYRRGVKLNRYFKDKLGERNIIFLDKIHLEKSIEALDECESSIVPVWMNTTDRGTCGGETASVGLYNQLHSIISNTGLSIHQNYSAIIDKIKYAILKETQANDSYTDFCLNKRYYYEPYDMQEKIAGRVSDVYYVPKLDVVLGFNAPKGFTKWLGNISNELGNQIVDYPILYGINRKIIKDLFVPLISIEIESSVNKHLNGGIVNMSKNSFVGVLVTRENADKHVEFYKKELGIKNVVTYQVEANDGK